jgi:predicted aldo/keto reductase-like oxidoreductase
VSRAGNDEEITRRDFLLRAAAGAAALGAVSGTGLSVSDALAGQAGGAKGMKHRVLGRTELKVSELGLGTIKTENPAVMRRALDLGINYFDTAECYQGGNAEVRLGEALAGRRGEAIVATKWHTNGRTPAEDLLASLESSLKRLKMDHVDLIQIHGAGRVGQVESDELWEAFSRAKQAGKVRFNGLSTHSNQVEVIRAAIKTGRYDAVLPSYNAVIGERVGGAIAEAKKAGLGVIAMKALQPVHDGKGTEAFAGLKGSPYQQAIQWLLRDQNVSTVIVDMPTFEQLDEDLGAVVTPPRQAEREEFERAVALVAAGTCHLCGACTGQCPQRVRVADIMRCRLYHDGYGDRGRARELYRALPAGASAAACVNCEQCRVICPWGVPVRERLEQVHGALA